VPSEGMDEKLQSEVVSLLLILRDLYADEVVPTMVDAGDHGERLEKIVEVLDALGYRQEDDL
jgi:hypothetical protein